MFLKIINSLRVCQLKQGRTSCFILGSLIFSLITPPSSAYVVIEKTLAIINNEPILLSDLTKLENRLSRSGMIDDLLLFDTPIETIKSDKNSKLQFLINERIVDSEVKKSNLTVTMDKVDQEIRDIAKRNNISKDDLMKTIEAQGIKPSEYQSFMKQRIERQSVVEQEITSKIRLSEEDILAFYSNETGKTLKVANEYTLSHIFFSPQKDGSNQALSRAQKVLTLINGGVAFDSLISKYTEEQNFSPNGFLGIFKSGEFSAEMERNVKDLKVGGVSEIVKSRTGFHIIKLVDRKVVSDPDYEKNKDKYRGQLFEKVFKRQFKAWIDIKRDEASIKIN